MGHYFHLLCLCGGVEKSEKLRYLGLFMDGAPPPMKIVGFHTAWPQNGSCKYSDILLCQVCLHLHGSKAGPGRRYQAHMQSVLAMIKPGSDGEVYTFAALIFGSVL